jgi:hypothetical protein
MKFQSMAGGWESVRGATETEMPIRKRFDQDQSGVAERGISASYSGGIPSRITRITESIGGLALAELGLCD